MYGIYARVADVSVIEPGIERVSGHPIKMHNSYYDSCSGSEDTKFCISLKTSSDASGFNKRSICFAGQNASFGDCQYDQLVFVSRLCAYLMS